MLLGYAPPSPDPHPMVETAIRYIKAVAHGAGMKM